MRLPRWLGGKSEINSHFGSAPVFRKWKLADPRVHKVLDSYEVLGGPHTFNTGLGEFEVRDGKIQKS